MTQPPDAELSLVPKEDAEDLYEHAPCGYLSTTRDGTIIRVNQTLLDWTGHAREDLVGRNFVELLSAGGRIYHETHYRPMLSMDGKVREIALDFVRADGTRFPALVNSLAARTEAGEPVVRTSIIDATHRREYERELLRARERAESSEARARELAQTLQASLMPPSLPDIEGVVIGATYRAAGDGADVGGDFYDVFEAGPDEWFVALGDVCGKGAEAATITALARYTVRAAAIRLRKPKNVLKDVNAVLLRHQTERFCTAVCARVQPMADGSVTVTISTAGHPPPLLVTQEGVQPVPSSGGLLGVLDDAGLSDTEVVLAPGEGILLYTDGFTEARRGDTMLGQGGFMDMVGHHRHLDPDTMTDELVEAIIELQPGGKTRDDMAAVYFAAPVAASGKPAEPG